MNSGEQIAYDFIIALLSTFLVIFCIVLIIFCRKKPVQSEETLPFKNSAQPFPLTDIDSATDNFNHLRIIGKGRLGTVYTAVLEGQELVAVKRIHPSLVYSNAGLGFSSILKSISLAQHPNVVPIFGYSQAPGERIIVMEFSGMFSLDYYLHENSDGASLLDWKKRLKIASGAATGLEYLHYGVAPNIIHGCFKSSNVLLDERYCPKICDYGLSFLAANEKRGLVGYVDDEYWQVGGGASKESDVYGFGVVLLELLTGRRGEEGLLVKWAMPMIKETSFRDILDPRLVLPSDLKPIIRLAKVASACISNSRKSRPTIAQVSAILNSLEIEINKLK